MEVAEISGTGLAQKLHSDTLAEYCEVRLSVVGISEFVLVEKYQTFVVDKDTWYSWAKMLKIKHFWKLWKQLKKRLLDQQMTGSLSRFSNNSWCLCPLEQNPFGT